MDLYFFYPKECDSDRSPPPGSWQDVGNEQELIFTS